MQQFNPIQSKWVASMQMRSVSLLQQSIPFLAATLYIIIQNFSSFIFYSCNARKTSSLHMIYFKTKHKQSNLLPSITIKYIFLHRKIRHFEPIVINTHIDYQNIRKCSVWCILKATARRLESVSSSIFCYIALGLENEIQKPDEFSFWFPSFFFLDFGGKIALPWVSVKKGEMLFQTHIDCIVCGDNCEVCAEID